MPPRVYDVTIRYTFPPPPSKLSRVVLHANASDEAVAIKRAVSALKRDEKRGIASLRLRVCPGALDGCALVRADV